MGCRDPKCEQELSEIVALLLAGAGGSITITEALLHGQRRKGSLSFEVIKNPNGNVVYQLLKDGKPYAEYR